MTIPLSDEAKRYLDRYLRRMQLALHGARSIDVQDVERDVLAHIDTELREDPKPVTWERLDAVLKKLGSPSQWLPTDELSWWRRMALRLWTGPEGWRLAYLCLGLFLLGMIPAPTMLLFLPASYLLARAAASLAAETDEPLGARRWLIYPPLVLVSSSLLVALLTCLVAPAVASVNLAEVLRDPGAPRAEIFAGWSLPVLATFLAAAATGAAWILVGSILAAWPGAVRQVFFPFGESFKRRYAWIVAALGLVFLLLALALGLIQWVL